MVTVRTYLDGAQAALAKSLLDDYEIPSELIDENAHLWCRAPFAVPIRLVVDDGDVERAKKFLDGDLKGAAAIEESAEEIGHDVPVADLSNEIPSESFGKNPWELLAVAFTFLLPAICFLQFEYPTDRPTFALRHEFASVAITHFLGWTGIAFALFLVVGYFRLRKARILRRKPGN